MITIVVAIQRAALISNSLMRNDLSLIYLQFDSFFTNPILNF